MFHNCIICHNFFLKLWVITFLLRTTFPFYLSLKLHLKLLCEEITGGGPHKYGKVVSGTAVYYFIWSRLSKQLFRPLNLNSSFTQCWDINCWPKLGAGDWFSTIFPLRGFVGTNFDHLLRISLWILWFRYIYLDSKPTNCWDINC